MSRVGKSLAYRVAIHNTLIIFPIYSLRSPTSNSRSEPLRYKIFADIAPDFIREDAGKGGRQRNRSSRVLTPKGAAWAEARQLSSIGRLPLFFKDRFWPKAAPRHAPTTTPPNQALPPNHQPSPKPCPRPPTNARLPQNNTTPPRTAPPCPDCGNT